MVETQQDDDWAFAEGTLQKWLSRARLCQHSHHNAGKICRLLGYVINVPVVALPALMGALAIVFMNEQVTPWWKGVFAILGVLSSALTVVELVFKFHEKGSRHTVLGAKYGALRRHIEEMLALPRGRRRDITDALEIVRRELDTLGVEEPVVSTVIFNMTVRELEKKDRKSSQ